MNKRLYVGRLDYDIGEEELIRIFSAFGNVESATVIREGGGNRQDGQDHALSRGKDQQGRSRGFAFVEMSTSEEAKGAIKELDGSIQGGRTISVSIAEPRGPSLNSGGGRRNTGGGHRRSGRMGGAPGGPGNSAHGGGYRRREREDQQY